MATNQPNRKQQMQLDHPQNTPPTTETVDLTPALAAEFLGKNHNNRNVRPMKVRAMVRDMLAGQWKFTHEAIGFDWNGKLSDGQHRCLAVIESGVTIRVIVVRGLDPDAQTVMDSGTRRTAADALRFRGIGKEPMIVASTARAWTAWDEGVFFRSANATMPALTTAEVLAWSDAHPESVEAVSFARHVYRGIGSTPTTIALAFMILSNINSRLAIEFFDSSAEARTNGKGDPRYAMLRAFQNLRTTSAATNIGVNLSVVIRAWNAWVAGKKVAAFPIMTGNNGVSVYVSVPKAIAPQAGVRL